TTDTADQTIKPWHLAVGSSSPTRDDFAGAVARSLAPQAAVREQKGSRQTTPGAPLGSPVGLAPGQPADGKRIVGLLDRHLPPSVDRGRSQSWDRSARRRTRLMRLI